MSNQIIVSYHAHCPDGMGAALSAYLKFRDTADYIPVSHTEEFPKALKENLSGKTVYCLDYCPKQPDLLHLLSNAGKVVLLDHHDGVAARTSNLILAGNGLSGVVDTTHSGAVLAWKYFFPGKEVPILLRYIEDRDIWAWKMQGTEAIMAYVDSLPMDMITWQVLVSPKTDIQEMIRYGESIVRYKRQLVEAALLNKRTVKFMGYEVLAVNTHEWLASDVGNTLSQGKPFAVVYYDLEGQRKFSLRSAKDGLNVRQLCEFYQGGGHVHAAGCSVLLSALKADGMPKYPTE